MKHKDEAEHWVFCAEKWEWVYFRGCTRLSTQYCTHVCPWRLLYSFLLAWRAGDINREKWETQIEPMGRYQIVLGTYEWCPHCSECKHSCRWRESHRGLWGIALPILTRCFTLDLWPSLQGMAFYLHLSLLYKLHNTITTAIVVEWLCQTYPEAMCGLKSHKRKKESKQKGCKCYESHI